MARPTRKPLLLLILTVCAPLGCGEEASVGITKAELLEKMPPLPAVPPSPTNDYADNADAAILGQMLFFDRGLSGPLTHASHLGELGSEPGVNCATCHTPQNWFTDISPSRTAIAALRTDQPTMSLVNTAHNTMFFRDGHRDSIWSQMIDNVEAELGGNRLRMAHVVYDKYRDLYEPIFGALPEELSPSHANADVYPPDASPEVELELPENATWIPAWEGMTPEAQDAATRVVANGGKAVGAYMRLLTSGNAPYDLWLAGDESAMSAAAKRGAFLFGGKAACTSCHSGAILADGEFHNVGVPQLEDADLGVGPTEDATGLEDGFASAIDGPFSSLSSYSDDKNTGVLSAVLDGASPEVSNIPDDFLGLFRTGFLRQIKHTAPYMHSGQFATLREVVEFYNEGGDTEGFLGEKDKKLVELNLTESEINDLVTFLEEGTTGEPLPAALLKDTSRNEPL